MGNHRPVHLVYGLIFAVFLSLTGCPPPTTTKPAPPPPAPRPEIAQRSPVAEETPPSSLQAFREGREAPSGRSGPLKDIYFDFDRANLRRDARETLKANSEWLKTNVSVRVEIEGHADERGTNEYNLALGAKRAQSAKGYLTTLGISANRLSTISYGEELPVCRDRTEECWQKNRRAHFVIIRVGPSS